MKKFRNLFIIGLTTTMIPVLLVIILLIFKLTYSSHKPQIDVSSNVTIHDTIKVVVHDTVKVVVRDVVFVDKKKTVNDTTPITKNDSIK